MKYDVIIIGAGLGGLTSGAKLAKEGKKVLIIEQHKIVGGCATTVKRKNFKIDIGFHKMDGFSGGNLKTAIFKDLDVFSNIQFIKIPEFYRFLNNRVDIVIPYDYKKAAEVLIKKFPLEKKGIKKFFNVISNIRKETLTIPKKLWKLIIMLPVLIFRYPYALFYSRKTAGKFLDSIIKDEDLKLTLLATIKYYHDDPYSLSLLFFAIAHGSLFLGANYIKDGSQNLSNYLASIIKNNDGDILLNHKAIQIITNKKGVTGVVYLNNKDKNEKKAFCNYVIANASIPNTVGELLKTKFKAKYKMEIKELKKACSILSIYLGFKKAVNKIGNNNYSTFVFSEDIWNISQMIENHECNNYNKINYVFVDYSQIDSGLAPIGKSVGVINTIDYYENWKHLTKIEYKNKKEKVANIFINRLEKLIPGIKKEIEFYEVSTPLTIKRYTLNPQGTPYGFAQIPNQAGLNRLSQKAPIKNLFYASAWNMPGGGFTGAILSGYTSAVEILKKNK